MSVTAKIADAHFLAESCKVVFDEERLRLNIEAGLDGEQVTKGDVHDWLEALGFSPAPDGTSWIGRRRRLRHFAQGEVLSIDSIQQVPDGQASV